MASELEEMDKEKRGLNAQLLTLQEEERSGIARDLHDEFSPALFAVNAGLVTISRLANQGREAEINKEIKSIADTVSDMQRQIKTMLCRLRPGVLADFGLTAAIRSMIEFWHRLYPKIHFHVRLPTDETSFGTLIDTTIYRIVQESLSNAVRHGNPAEISVSVRLMPAGGREQRHICVEVANDGHGMDIPAGFGFGLTGMKERVQVLGGHLILRHDLGSGFQVAATLPLPAIPSNPVPTFSFAGKA